MRRTLKISSSSMTLELLPGPRGELAGAFPPFRVLRWQMKDDLILRYKHNYFRGWRVRAKRRGRCFTRYFSDHPQGRREALRAARVFRDKLMARLPPPTKIKIKRTDIRNTTGVIGVASVKRARWIRKRDRALCRIMVDAQWQARQSKLLRWIVQVKNGRLGSRFRLGVRGCGISRYAHRHVRDSCDKSGRAVSTVCFAFSKIDLSGYLHRDRCRIIGCSDFLKGFDDTSTLESCATA